MIRTSTIIWLLILFISAFCLFQVKYKVQDLRKDLAEINRQLEQERDAIHVLKAEWAYLNQPDRLRSIAERHLELVPVKVGQIAPSLDRAVFYAGNDSNTKNNKHVQVAAIEPPINEGNAAPQHVAASKSLTKTTSHALHSTSKQLALLKPAIGKNAPAHTLQLPQHQPSIPTMEPILTSLQTERE